jgi:hypothetical protein
VITVRFPSGFSVQYNEANQVTSSGKGFHDVVRKEPFRWYARVGPDCLIEGQSPCRTYNAANSSAESELKQKIDALCKEVRLLGRKIAKQKEG